MMVINFDKSELKQVLGYFIGLNYIFSRKFRNSNTVEEACDFIKLIDFENIFINSENKEIDIIFNRHLQNYTKYNKTTYKNILRKSKIEKIL